MSRLPGIIVVVDAKKEHLALAEAKKLGLATVGILDTDSNPDAVDVAIPANDDSIRAIGLILSELADAAAIGKTMVGIQQDAAQRQRRAARSKRPALASATGAATEAIAPSPTPAPVPVSDTPVQDTPAPASDTPAPEPEEKTEPTQS